MMGMTKASGNPTRPWSWAGHSELSGTKVRDWGFVPTGRLPLELGCIFGWSNSLLSKAVPREQLSCESSESIILLVRGKNGFILKDDTPQDPLHQRRQGHGGERDSLTGEVPSHRRNHRSCYNDKS